MSLRRRWPKSTGGTNRDRWMFTKAFRATFGVGCALVVGLIALVLISGALVNSSGQIRNVIASVSPLANATATPQRTWTVVAAWTGSGTKDTEKFTVGNEWRIDYTPGGQIFQIYLYDASNNALTDVAANTQATTPDTSFQHKAGTYYMKINAIGNWKVTVQDMR